MVDIALLVLLDIPYRYGKGHWIDQCTWIVSNDLVGVSASSLFIRNTNERQITAGLSGELGHQRHDLPYGLLGPKGDDPNARGAIVPW